MIDIIKRKTIVVAPQTHRRLRVEAARRGMTLRETAEAIIAAGMARKQKGADNG